MECVICLEELELNTTISKCNRCKQIIHYSCSLKCNNKCPFCRYEGFKNYDNAIITIQKYYRRFIALKNL